MNKPLLILSLLAALAAVPARAGEDSGLALGLRGAYAVPLGSAGDGTALRDLATGAAPLQLELGWRFDPRWQVGAYFAWGPAFLASEGKRALEARGATGVQGHFEQRVGLQGIYTIAPGLRLAPWVGLGLGYEWTRYASAEVGGAETELGLRGFEGSLQVGGAWRLSPRFTVGPFASLSAGRYDSYVSWSEEEGAGDSDVHQRRLHGWLQLGVKGAFDL